MSYLPVPTTFTRPSTSKSTHLHSFLLVALTSLATYLITRQHYHSPSPSTTSATTECLSNSTSLVQLPAAAILSPTVLISRPRTHFHSDLVTPIIHQSYYSTSLPTLFSSLSKTWRIHHPEWEYVLWTDEDNDLLVETLFPQLKDVYYKLPKGIYRADFVRGLYMIAFGGIYADLDVECLRPFDTLFRPTSTTQAYLGRMGHNATFPDSLPNAFMASAPGHPFFLLPLQRAFSFSENSRKGTWLDWTGLDRGDDRPETITGPQALFHAYEDYISPDPAPLVVRSNLVEEERDHTVIVLDESVIFPYSWEQNGQVNPLPVCSSQKKHAKEFDRARCQDRMKTREKGSYSISYWSHSWA